MIQSVARAMKLLELLGARDGTSAALGELAERSRLKAPTAHNLLHTLVALGYAAHDPCTRRYSLGEKARVLGRRQFVVSLLVGAAAPVLESLRAEFGETVLLAMYRNGMRETVAAAESERSLRVGAQVGTDRNLYGTATGRVLLSLLERDAVGAFVQEHGLPGDRWPNVTLPDELFDELSRIRDARFADLRRADGDVCAAAVPVPLADPSVPVALGMYYPSARSPRGGMRRVRKHLHEGAARIAREFET